MPYYQANDVNTEDGHLDAGDFVLDALGERWASQLCHENYSSPGYFSGESQDSPRWQYYRSSSAGQNILLYNNSNQLVTGSANIRFGRGSEERPSFWIADLTSFYGGPRIQRALRFINNRTSILIQDEIRDSPALSQWRMHTRANIHLLYNGRFACKWRQHQNMVCSIVHANPK